MRDKLRTKEYFDTFIEEELEGIKMFEDSLADGEIEEDRIDSVKDEILLIKLGIIIAKYSRGDSLDAIRQEFEDMIGLFCESWDGSIYEDNLWFASIAYLLGLDSVKLNKIRDKLMESDTYDYLIDFILSGAESDFDNNMISFPRSYKNLVKSINENDKDALISNSKRVLFQKGDKNKVVYKVLDSNLYLTIYNKIFVPKKFLTKRDLNKITKLQNRFKGIYVREVEQTLNRLKASNCILETMLLLVERAYNHAMKKITFTNLRRTFLDPFNKIDDELKFEDKIYFKLPGGFYNIKQNDNLKKENNIN